MDTTSLIVQLISGAVGGNIAGALMKKFSLGTVGNSIVGILGGALGGQLLGMIGAGGAGAAAAGSGDMGSILQNVLAGGAGGGALMAIIGVVKGMMAKS